jgi:hypothetical protein
MAFSRFLICLCTGVWVLAFSAANRGQAADLDPKIREAAAWIDTLVCSISEGPRSWQRRWVTRSLRGSLPLSHKPKAVRTTNP